ncbi:hypothetical protein D3C85_1650390 [compost metagenome]
MFLAALTPALAVRISLACRLGYCSRKLFTTAKVLSVDPSSTRITSNRFSLCSRSECSKGVT